MESLPDQSTYLQLCFLISSPLDLLSSFLSPQRGVGRLFRLSRRLLVVILLHGGISNESQFSVVVKSGGL